MDFGATLLLVCIIGFVAFMIYTGRNSSESEDTVELPPAAELKKMTKVKLDEWAKENGIELDRRQTKANMIAELEKKR